MSEWPTIALLCGGPSGERDVSLASAAAVRRALESAAVRVVQIDVEPRRIQAQLAESGADFVFNVCHGQFGEDGLLQACLEASGLPYTGSGVLASALAMDKWRSKRLWQAAGLPTTRGRRLRRGDAPDPLRISQWPVFVKPNRAGSSLGISRVERAEDLGEAMARAFAVDSEILVEEAVLGLEATVGIVGERAMPPIVIRPHRLFYDYEAKYLADDTEYLLPSGLPAATERRLQELALQAFRELDGCDWGRVDFLVDDRQDIYLLELNAVPGMTDHSLIPMAAKAMGWSMTELCLEIVSTAQRRWNRG